MQEYRVETSELGVRALTQADFDFVYQIATHGGITYQLATKFEPVSSSTYFDFEFVYSRKDIITLVDAIWAKDKACLRYAVVNKRDNSIVSLCGIGISENGLLQPIELVRLPLQLTQNDESESNALGALEALASILIQGDLRAVS